jgi:hypothetical protein
MTLDQDDDQDDDGRRRWLTLNGIPAAIKRALSYQATVEALGKFKQHDNPR